MKVLIVLFILLSLPELNKNQIKSDFQGYNMSNGHVKARLKTKINFFIFIGISKQFKPEVFKFSISFSLNLIFFEFSDLKLISNIKHC